MDLQELLKQYKGDDTMLSSKSLTVLMRVTDRVHFQKGETVIEEGKYHQYAYLILHGAARSYYLKDGTEVTNWFAFENEFVGTLQNYLGSPSSATIQFIEDSDCLRFHITKLQEEQTHDIGICNFVCSAMQDYAIFLEDRLRLLQYNDGMERYRYVLEHEPDIIKRVPLTYLAYYLGVTRETLSRLRKKIIM